MKAKLKVFHCPSGLSDGFNHRSFPMLSETPLQGDGDLSLHLCLSKLWDNSWEQMQHGGATTAHSNPLCLRHRRQGRERILPITNPE